MNLEDYLNILKEVKLPLELKTKIFIDGFSIDHSWYKHLPDDRNALFVFYINEKGNWEYYYKNFPPTLDLPIELVEMGTIGLSKFIFGNFKTINDLYYDKSNLTYAEMHKNEVDYLFKHLISFLDNLKIKLL